MVINVTLSRGQVLTHGVRLEVSVKEGIEERGVRSRSFQGTNQALVRNGANTPRGFPQVFSDRFDGFGCTKVSSTGQHHGMTMAVLVLITQTESEQRIEP
jgi:hypothetical protein